MVVGLLEVHIPPFLSVPFQPSVLMYVCIGTFLQVAVVPASGETKMTEALWNLTHEQVGV